ncbi:hydantoinase/oxoprolinase family protein [Roseomonas sp. BN140053]|uniref:hydantoinase/oxoprolinase family protein n=1 Tax=Roseomonas sp. BN140053 TaxID=3391898 RepID=UPI0039EC82DA
MGFRIGVDIGGTFTDLCMLDEDTGAVRALKVLSTPAEPSRDVMAGLAGLSERHGAGLAEVRAFTLGTTVGVNAIIQRRGARLALFATAGFADVLEIARLRMPQTMNLYSRRPPPLVSRDHVFEVRGRILADGTEAEPLSEADLRDAVAAARRCGAEGVVVAFLNSYRNPAHERAAKELLARIAPELFVFGSAEVWPAIREYERTTTAILNGYVHPRVSGYITALQGALAAAGMPAELMATKSNGGVMRAELGRTACVSMLLSGTAAGVIGASHLARRAGHMDCLTLDIGGTSADVAFVLGGQPQYGTGEQVGEFPLHIPSVSVSSIGEGGGSVAWVDEFGVLKVGPDSAGSDPGPACYGRGGTWPTVTDAFAVLGFLGHSQLGFGAVQPDRALAEAALRPVAARLSLSLQQAAEQIVEIGLSGMFLEVSKLFAQRGMDPGELALFAFGGAGPMMGPMLARELGIRTVLIPPSPGVVSALGGLVAAPQGDVLRTVFAPLEPASLPQLATVAAELSDTALAWLRDDQNYRGEHRLQLLADLRYSGQSFEIEVPLEATWLSGGDLAALRAAFDNRHEALYGFADPAAAAQVVNLRAVISGSPVQPALAELPPAEGVLAPVAVLEVFLHGRFRSAPLYRRSEMRQGHHFAGPAVIAQDDTTVCIPDGFSGLVDRHGNLVLTLPEGAPA